MKKIFTLFAAVLFASNMMALNAYVYGAWDGWSTQADFVTSDGGVTYSATLEISSVGTWDFAIINYATSELITRTHNEVVFDGSTGNSRIEIDEAGEYTFTLTLATRLVVVTYPAKSGSNIDNPALDTKATKRMVNGQLVIEKNGKLYNALGAEVK